MIGRTTICDLWTADRAAAGGTLESRRPASPPQIGPGRAQRLQVMNYIQYSTDPHRSDAPSDAHPAPSGTTDLQSETTAGPIARVPSTVLRTDDDWILPSSGRRSHPGMGGRWEFGDGRQTGQATGRRDQIRSSRMSTTYIHTYIHT